jgi:hypothetical protein
MRHALVALALLAAAPAAAEESPLRRSVQAFYATSARVQRAVVRDVCFDSDAMNLSSHGRSRLRRAERHRYDAVLNRLGDAYAAVAEPTDGNLEAVTGDFCDAVDTK